MVARDRYVYKNGKIYGEHSRKPLKYEKLEGCHNNYQITRNDKVKIFLKQSEGRSDYADVISKRICDALNIKCANCELVYMQDFPQDKEEKLLTFEEYVEFCKQNFNITNENQLKQTYEDYCKQFKSDHTKTAVLSYDYQMVEPYKSAKIIRLSDLVEAYCSITGSEGTIAIETYVKIAKELCDRKSKVGKALRKKLKLKNNIELSQFFDLDLKKIALLGYATCQMDMRSYNIHLAVVKTSKGYQLEVAPLFDNGESFNLSDIDSDRDVTKLDIDLMNNSSGNYGNQITLTENVSRDAQEQLVSLAQEIIVNPELAKYYDALRWLDIESICDKENVGEDNFDIVKHCVVSIFNERMKLLQQEVQRQQQKETQLDDTEIKTQSNNQVHTQQIEFSDEFNKEEDLGFGL